MFVLFYQQEQSIPPNYNQKTSPAHEAEEVFVSISLTVQLSWPGFNCRVKSFSTGGLRFGKIKNAQKGVFSLWRSRRDLNPRSPP